MNILFYLSRFPGYGGIETVTEIIGNRLIDMGHHICILTHVKQDRPSVLINRSDYFFMPEEGEWGSTKNRTFAVDLIKKYNFDVIIVQDSYAPFEGVVCSMKVNQEKDEALIIFEHSTPLYINKKLKQSYKASVLHELYRRLYSWPKQLMANQKRHKLMLANCDAYVVLAKGYIDELAEVCGEKWIRPYNNKIRVINNPISQPIKSADFCDKDNVVLFVGQVNENKRVGLMIEMWRRIAEHFPNWKMQIVGDGPQLSELKNRTTELNIHNIEFCGYQQPDPYYRKAKLFWMTSGYEGWPLTLVEAMQHGCVPIAMNNFSSVQDIIDNGINGSIVEADNIEQFIKASETLMEKEDVLKSFSSQAQIKTKSFEIDRIIDNWEDLLVSVKGKQTI